MLHTYPQIVESIQKESYAPIYFLQGEEPYFINCIVQSLQDRVVPEANKSYNYHIIYGKESTIVDVISLSKKFPMMPSRQLIVVKDTFRLNDWNKETSQNYLISYLERAAEDTVLVLCYGPKTLDKRLKIYKYLLKNSCVYTSKKIYNNQLPSWIFDFVKSKKRKISLPNCMMITENVGNNLEIIANEINKLIINVPENQEITSDHIHDFIGISREYNNFELQKAIGLKNYTQVVKIIYYFSLNPNKYPLTLILSTLHSYFFKLLKIHSMDNNTQDQIAKTIGVHPFFVKEYQSACRHYPLSKVMENIELIYQAELQSKGINRIVDTYDEILIELIYQLIH